MPKLETARARGNYGERVAAQFLKRQGFRILVRNFAVRDGEIDLICREGKVLAFVEVRARRSEEFGRPGETIDARKQEALRRTAERYLTLLGRPGIFHRFDAVEVMLEEGKIPVCQLHRDWFS